MSEKHWRWAIAALLRNGAAVLAIIAVSIAARQYGATLHLAYLLLIPAMLLGYAFLEMRLFADALHLHAQAPARFWSGPRVIGFAWRWLALAVLFQIAPIALLFVGVVFSDDPYPSMLFGRSVAFLSAMSWWCGYALMGSALPDFLSGGSGGLGEALRRPGFARRLRALAPAGALFLASTLGANEVAGLAEDIDLPSSVAVLGDLAAMLAVALAARALTDDLLAHASPGEAVVKVFE